MVLSEFGFKILAYVFHIYFNITGVAPFDFIWNLHKRNLEIKITNSKLKVIYSVLLAIVGIPIIVTSIHRLLFAYAKGAVFGPEFMLHFGTLVASTNVITTCYLCLVHKKELVVFFNQLNFMNTKNSKFISEQSKGFKNNCEFKFQVSFHINNIIKLPSFMSLSFSRLS